MRQEVELCLIASASRSFQQPADYQNNSLFYPRFLQKCFWD